MTKYESRHSERKKLIWIVFILRQSQATFEEADRSQSLSLEDIDQTTGPLMAAADTIQLLISAIESNNDFAEVLPILNVTPTNVRNLGDLLQQHRKDAPDLTRGTACSIAQLFPHAVVQDAHVMLLRKNKYVFLREMHSL